MIPHETQSMKYLLPDKKQGMPTTVKEGASTPRPTVGMLALGKSGMPGHLKN